MTRDDDGSTLVEVALLLPVLVLLAAGVFELGRAIYSHHALSKSTRDASRFLARVADPNDVAFQSLAANYVRTGSYGGTAPALVGDDPAQIGVAFTINAIANPEPKIFYGPDVLYAVAVRATYAFRSGLLEAFKLSGPDGIPMTVTHVQRHIGE